jgi:methanogenic corrinoid protein MtbC1
MQDKLYKELAELGPVPEHSAEAYHEEMVNLVDHVNKTMSSRSDICRLIGNNPMSTMFENHRNHAAFMDNLLRLNALHLLSGVVPWVYRAYHNHGFSHDYFPAHLQAWKAALREKLEPDTAGPILRVYDWMLAHHGDFIDLSREAVFLSYSASEHKRDVRKQFVLALLRGDRRACLEISREHAAGPSDLLPFYMDILQPSMYRIGELWEQGEITAAKEHLASALVNSIMSGQYIRLMPDSEPTKGRVLVTAAPNEFHVIGAQMVANCLEVHGWDVDFLGADTPPEDLLGYVRESAPDIVALSVSMPFNLLDAREIIDRIRQAFPERRPRIMLGGLAFLTQPDLVSRIGGDGYAEDCRQAIALAEEWREEDAHANDAAR